MSSIVLELQQELLKSDCDVLNALRKAHLIASKLKLTEFDAWIQCELNGYLINQDEIPDYRRVNGQVKAWNPYHGWVPVIFQDSKLEDVICNRKLEDSISDIIELYNKSSGSIILTFTADIANKLDSWCDASFRTNYSLHVSKHHLKSIIDRVTNCLLEWTLELESKGVLGENMTFNQSESAAASEISQQINNYYLGQVVNGNVSGSQLMSGDNNTVTYNDTEALRVLKETREALNQDKISEDDMASAIELLEEISSKIEQKKKPGIIKAALSGLKDFLINAGANVAAGVLMAYITAKLQGV